MHNVYWVFLTFVYFTHTGIKGAKNKQHTVGVAKWVEVWEPSWFLCIWFQCQCHSQPPFQCHC